MLVISKKQFDKMAEAGTLEFEANMLRHIRQFSPLHTQTRDDETLRKLIRLGKHNAAEYGFSRMGPVRFFIELMILLGAYFDTDPQYPWIQVVLNDSDFYPNQLSKADQLHNLYIDYHKNVIGENGEYALAALMRLNDFENKKKLAEDYTQGKKELIEIISSIYPEKSAFLGKGLLNDLISRACRKADQYDINFNEGRNLFVGLTFTIGHKFDEDPMYAWITDTFKDTESTKTTNQEIQGLIEKFKFILKRT